jgi:hypothetical protein
MNRNTPAVANLTYMTVEVGIGGKVSYDVTV